MATFNITALRGDQSQNEWVCQIIATEGVVGFLGNLIVCLVILRAKFLHTLTNYMLINLAAADGLLCLCAFFDNLVASPNCALLRYVSASPVGRELFCRLLASHFLTWVFGYASAFNLCLVTLERYAAIVHPLKYARLLTATRMKALVALTWWTSVLMSLPFPFTIQSSDDPQKACSTFQYSHQAVPILLGVFVVLINYLLPIILMSLAYYKIQVTLKQQAAALGLQQARAAAYDLLIARQRLVSMLTVVLGALAVLWTPGFLTVLLCLDPTESSTFSFCGSQGYRYARGVGNILFYFNSVINPVIYEFKYKKFRQGLRQLFCRCFNKHGTNSVDTEMTPS
ncbi:somatostatin receptor type 4-like [Acanthaster planci]|uniref:Somatostatin receptor type 4-like n=1 Tax=Acanthaster planci TaxID=133434 RepID=A0A8B7Z7W2_ACAPL|nr:somatostatin receptor type 4-like [Acanthaster planci]